MDPEGIQSDRVVGPRDNDCEMLGFYFYDYFMFRLAQIASQCFSGGWWEVVTAGLGGYGHQWAR